MTTLTGKCHCGKNSFKLSAEPQFQFVCYCNDCQALHGGGRLCGMAFPKVAMTEATDVKTYSYAGGSGSDIHMHFCPHCSTQLYAYPQAYPEAVMVKANVLDDKAAFVPQQNLFTEEACAWDQLAKVA